MHYQCLLGSCRIAACSTDPVASATSRQGADNFELRDRPTSVSISKDQGSGRSPSSSFDRRAARWTQRRQKPRSEEHTSELQSLMRISYAVFCLKKQKLVLHIHNKIKT